MMDEEEYQAGMAELRRDWGQLVIDPKQQGVARATNDPTTGILIGRRAPLIAEIINRAIKEGRTK